MWNDSNGDRRQELVFIGTKKMNKELIMNSLQQALVTKEEIGLGSSFFKTLRNPFSGNQK